MTDLKNLTEQEKANLELAKEYMRIAYTPGEASADAVTHLCAPNNRFVGPTTFPGTETLEQYPELEDVFAQLSPLLTDETMRELNARVDQGGEEPGDVAYDWMVEQGLITPAS